MMKRISSILLPLALLGSGMNAHAALAAIDWSTGSTTSASGTANGLVITSTYTAAGEGNPGATAVHSWASDPGTNVVPSIATAGSDSLAIGHTVSSPTVTMSVADGTVKDPVLLFSFAGLRPGTSGSNLATVTLTLPAAGTVLDSFNGLPIGGAQAVVTGNNSTTITLASFLDTATASFAVSVPGTFTSLSFGYSASYNTPPPGGAVDGAGTALFNVLGDFVPTPVPEPSASMVLGLCAWLGLLRRGKRQ